MDNPPFIIERIYNAPIERVWRAITDRDEMAEWYFNLKEFKAEVGFAFEFQAGPDGGTQYTHKCVITEVIPEQKLTYSWRYEGYPGNSFVTFELNKQDENYTLLTLTHRGLETFSSDNSALGRENFANGWNYFVNLKLKEYLEKTSE